MATARSESAAELLCAELAFDGLPIDIGQAEAVIATFVFWTHRANIGRLRRGEENRFGKRGRA